MFILRKTFDDDTSGIEVHDGEKTYRFQIEGDVALYLGKDSVPQSVQDEIKNQGYASSVTYDVPGSIKEYVDANAGGGGSGTATKVESPEKGSGSYLPIVNDSGTEKGASVSFADNRGVVISNKPPSGSLPIGSIGVEEYSTTEEVASSFLRAKVPVPEGIPKTAEISVNENRIAIDGPNSTYPIKVSGGVVEFSNNASLKHPVVDVTSVSSPQKGMIAYNDGTTGTEGPAYYNGSSWQSLVDGSTI